MDRGVQPSPAAYAIDCLLPKSRHTENGNEGQLLGETINPKLLSETTVSAGPYLEIWASQWTHNSDHSKALLMRRRSERKDQVKVR